MLLLKAKEMKCAVPGSSRDTEARGGTRAGTSKEQYKCGLLREWLLFTEEQLLRDFCCGRKADMIQPKKQVCAAPFQVLWTEMGILLLQGKVPYGCGVIYLEQYALKLDWPSWHAMAWVICSSTGRRGEWQCYILWLYGRQQEASWRKGGGGGRV